MRVDDWTFPYWLSSLIAGIKSETRSFDIAGIKDRLSEPAHKDSRITYTLCLFGLIKEKTKLLKPVG